MKRLALILALLIPHVAMARIGETEAECDKRYGEVTEIGKSDEGFREKSYKKGDFETDATFIEGRCVVLIINVISDKPDAFGEEQAKAIVNNNMTDPIEDKKPVPGGGRSYIEWKGSNGKVTATYQHDIDLGLLDVELKGTLVSTLSIFHSLWGETVDALDKDKPEPKKQAPERKEAPEFEYSDVKDFIKSKTTDRNYQKTLLKDARDAYRAVSRVKDYKKLSREEVIAVKWDCFDDFPHDWNMINYVLMERLFEANKEK